jgi:hypothetical protein
MAIISNILLLFLVILSPQGISAMTAHSNALSRDFPCLSRQSDSEDTCSDSYISNQSGIQDFDSNRYGKEQPGIPISNKYRSDKREYRYVMNDRLHHRIYVPGLLNESFKDAQCLLIVVHDACIQTGETLLTVEKKE